MKIFEDALNGELSKESHEQVIDAILSYIIEDKSVDELLGFKKPGNTGRKARSIFLKNVRDGYLGLAWDNLNHKNTEWLLGRIERVRHLEKAPSPKGDKTDYCIYQALRIEKKCKIKIPATTNGLENAIYNPDAMNVSNPQNIDRI